MESNERELIERAVITNFELKKLYAQHAEFEKRLDVLSKLPFLTADEQIEVKTLKHKKLRGVERMMQIISNVDALEAEQQAA